MFTKFYPSSAGYRSHCTWYRSSSWYIWDIVTLWRTNVRNHWHTHKYSLAPSSTTTSRSWWAVRTPHTQDPVWTPQYRTPTQTTWQEEHTGTKCEVISHNTWILNFFSPVFSPWWGKFFGSGNFENFWPHMGFPPELFFQKSSIFSNKSHRWHLVVRLSAERSVYRNV